MMSQIARFSPLSDRASERPRIWATPSGDGERVSSFLDVNNLGHRRYGLSHQCFFDHDYAGPGTEDYFGHVESRGPLGLYRGCRTGCHSVGYRHFYGGKSGPNVSTASPGPPNIMHKCA